MEFTFEVSVTVERTEGKFATRDEVEEALVAAISDFDADLSGLGADGSSEYEVTDSSVNPVQGASKAKNVGLIKPKSSGKLREKVQEIGNKAAAARLQAIELDKQLDVLLEGRPELNSLYIGLRELVYDTEQLAYRLSSELI